MNSTSCGHQMATNIPKAVLPDGSYVFQVCNICLSYKSSKGIWIESGIHTTPLELIPVREIAETISQRERSHDYAIGPNYNQPSIKIRYKHDDGEYSVMVTVIEYKKNHGDTADRMAALKAEILSFETLPHIVYGAPTGEAIRGEK